MDLSHLALGLDTVSLINYKATHNLFMIVRFEYTNIDRMSDTGIEKSAPYTIDGKDMRMSVVGRLDPPHLRIEPKNPNVTIEYDVAILPKDISLDRVNSIADVERLGGRILSTNAQTVPFDALGVKIVPKE